jgi:hypothetical protein
MTPINTRDVSRVLLAGVLTATLYRFWLTTPVLEHLSQNQWRAIAISVAAIAGISSSLAKWNLSTLVIGSMAGLLVSGTWVALPVSHGRVGNAFRANLELLGFDMSAFIVAAVLGWYCISRLTNNYGHTVGGKDVHPNGG